MATVHYINTTEKLGNTLNSTVGNASVGASIDTSKNLESNKWYAYTDGYTKNSNGWQQNTGLGYLVKLVFKFGKPNLTKRTISLKVGAYFKRDDYMGSNNTLSLNLIANEEKQTYSKMTALNTKWLLTVYKTVTLSYTDNGNAATTLKLTGSNNTGSCSDINCSVTVKAPTIAKKEKTVSLSFNKTELILDGQDSINITPSDMTGVKINISMYFNTATSNEIAYDGYIVQGYSSSSAYNYKPPTGDVVGSIKSIAGCMENRTSVSAIIVCETFTNNSSATSLGKKTYSITLKLSNTAKYNISSMNVVESTKGTVPVGGFKIDLHKLKIVANLQDNSNGATITKIVANFGNETLTYADSSSISSVLSNNVISISQSKGVYSTSQTITLSITDNRGNVVTKSVNISATAPPILPSIPVLNVGRCESNGTDDDTADYCKVKFTVTSARYLLEREYNGDSVDSHVDIYVFYKIVNQNDSEFVSAGAVTTLNFDSNGTASGEIIVTGSMNGNNPYVIKLSAQDSWGAIYRQTNLSTAFALLEFHKEGKSIGIGCKTSDVLPRDLLIGMETRFYQDVYLKDGSLCTSSDEKRKDNIKLLSDLLNDDILLNLFSNINPIAFTYKNKENDKMHLGFSANKFKEELEKNGFDSEFLSIVEETETIEKDPITKKEKIEKYLTMKYDEIIPILFLMVKIILRELNNINIRLTKMEGSSNGKNSQDE